MASLLLSNLAIDSIKGLEVLCSERNLEVRFHDCNVLSTSPFNCNACVTVNETTLEGRGKTIEAAKQDAANRMIAHLEGKIVNPYESKKKSKEINWNSPKMKHPCDRLQVFCGKMGVSFQFSDCRSVSMTPPKYSATATVLGVTVTAEGTTREEARKNVATELLIKLGWDNKENENKIQNNLNKQETSTISESSKPASTLIQQLEDLCLSKKKSFVFHDIRALTSKPLKYTASLTVNGVTIIRPGQTVQESKDEATVAMIHHLEGKPVNFGYDTRRKYMMSNLLSQTERSDPSIRLQYLCQKKGVALRYYNVWSKPSTCTATATVLHVTITANAKTIPEAKRSVATQILAKLGWDKTNCEDGLLLKEIKVENNTQDIHPNVERFDTELQQKYSFESHEKKPVIPSTSSSIGMTAESLLNNPKRSDIAFVVSKSGEQREKIYGHSLIISLGSPILNELFEGDWKDKEEVEIQCHPLSFMSIMRYVYTQEIIVIEDHLVETIILAMKYGLSGFMEDVISKQYLTEDFLKDNVCSLLQLAHEQNCTKEIWHQAATYFDKHAEELIRKDSFLNLSVEVITSLIQRTGLSVNELSLFYSTVLWAGKRCDEEGLEASDENLRSKMEPFIHYIRFPLMTGDEFREGPGKTGILTGDECYKILCAICLGDKQECGFSYNPRYIINGEATDTESTLGESESGKKDLITEVPQGLHQNHALNKRSEDYVIPDGKYAGLTRCQRRNRQRAQKKQRERLGL